MDRTGPESLTDIADVVFPEDCTDREIHDTISEYHAIIARGSFEIPSDLIARAENLKVISKHGTGVDNIDVDAASEHGVLVANTPGANAQSVAEHSLGLLIATRKNMFDADRDLANGKWSRYGYSAPQLRGATIGIYGCGDIGSRVARFTAGLGMRCLAYDPYLTDNQTPPEVDLVGSLDELFERSDVVSIHTPLTDETRGTVTATRLRELGPDGLLVNAARGGIVDEDDLVDVLNAGEIAGAGLDVFSEEPPDLDRELFSHPAVITTPHIAGTSEQSSREKSVRAADNVRAVYNGELPESVVNLNAFVDLAY
ncbi:hydroxyacid dehydrogenase [Halorubrum sp. DTA98]|uniref:hydroxyacid dehydrogenase n=1 Tax=Halorubrum sp. DTA98 TaxID=3402163 RepID=UPI003AAC1C3C